MFKKILLALSLFLPFVVGAQLKVNPGKFPVEETKEWPGKGTLLIAPDPSKRTQEISLGLLNYEGNVQWNKSIYPKSKATHLILSASSDYIYFVDDLKLDGNFIKYNQINQSGSVIPTRFDMLPVIRKHRYTTPGDLELKEIVNTPKALVFYFQLPVKDKGIIENFFVTITHHNNRVYHCLAPAFDMESYSKNEEDDYVFAGAEEDRIYFSRYGKEGHANTVGFFSFTSKAEEIETISTRPLGLNALNSEVNFVDLSGTYYLKKETKTNTFAQGKGIFFEGAYYYAVNDGKEGCLKIYGQNSKGEYVSLTECQNKAELKRRNSSSLSFIHIDKSLYVSGEINGKTQTFRIKDGKISSANDRSFDYEKIRENPSSFSTRTQEKGFVHLLNGKPTTIEFTE